MNHPFGSYPHNNCKIRRSYYGLITRRRKVDPFGGLREFEPSHPVDSRCKQTRTQFKVFNWIQFIAFVGANFVWALSRTADCETETLAPNVIVPPLSCSARRCHQTRSVNRCSRPKTIQWLNNSAFSWLYWMSLITWEWLDARDNC